MESEFRIIDEYPAYEINREGVVRRISDGFIPKVSTNVRYNKSVSLFGKNGFRRVYIDRLLRVCFSTPSDKELTRLDLFGFHEYAITRNGEVWSYTSHKFLSQSLCGHGYPFVSLWKDNKEKAIMTHRIVAILFTPNPDNKQTVNHIDGNKLNNRASNLEWMTHGENNSHAIYNDLRVNVLHTTKVHEICLYIQTNRDASITNISDHFGIKYSRVEKIRYRSTWTHISKDYEW